MTLLIQLAILLAETLDKIGFLVLKLDIVSLIG